MPAGAAQRIIERELGAPVEERFDRFDPVPLGSASIGQVHRAVLRDGEVVAVKVQRPEAPGGVESDLELMREFANFLDRRFGRRIFVDVRGLVAEFETVIRRELDYTAEAANARRFGANFAETPVALPTVHLEYSTSRVLPLQYIEGTRYREIRPELDNTAGTTNARRFGANFAETPVVIPRVHLEYSTSRVLTLQYIEGTRFREIRPLLLAPSERRRVASMGAGAIFKMAFEDGFFHGDPHPGNLILTPQGDLALLDFGMVGYMSRGDIEALSRLFIAVVQRDAAAALRGLEALGVRYSPEVRADLVRDLREFLSKYSGLSVGEVTLGQALSELISLARRYRLRVPPVFPLLTKALVTAEGLARAIDPSTNVYEVARPYARRLLLQRCDPEAVLDGARERALEYARYVEDYPEQLRQLLTEVADGELEVQLRHGGLDELVSGVDVLANRLVFAVVTGALLLGSCVLGAFDRGGPQVPYLGVPVVSFIGFTLALIMGSLLLVIIFRSRRL